MTDKNDSLMEQARRRLLKTIVAAGGAITTGSLLPDSWKRPIVDIALLPAHAQTSASTVVCSLNVELVWNGSGDDFDLLLETPSGTLVDPKATPQSQYLQHSGDNMGNSSNPFVETISNIGPSLNSGTYRMFIRSLELNTPSLDYTISGCGINISVTNTTSPASATTLVETFTVPGP